ncbi:hypothetical protein M2105_001958 [Paenibacillus sp. PastF-1]|nr:MULTISPECIES: hypothetical protein [unclassified Paenibacillus]MDF9854113.1 hypothetical protein [Paenibacillus sp. PastF-1]MDH6479386.1 hypothetical protein [Paenibacillus sp. PastH-2]MDH6506881.1 hypothetical protein [Paenibacillus sp. PastM-3]
MIKPVIPLIRDAGFFVRGTDDYSGFNPRSREAQAAVYLFKK